MARITKRLLIYCICSLYISFTIAAGGVVQHFFSGVMKQPIRISFRNARSPNSRGCLSINLNNRTPTKPGRSIEKGKTDGADPRQKKNQKKRRKNKKMSTKKKKKSGVGGISETSSAYCPDIPPTLLIFHSVFFFFVFSVFFIFPPDYWLITIRSWLIT